MNILCKRTNVASGTQLIPLDESDHRDLILSCKLKIIYNITINILKYVLLARILNTVVIKNLKNKQLYNL